MHGQHTFLSKLFHRRNLIRLSIKETGSVYLSVLNHDRGEIGNYTVDK